MDHTNYKIPQMSNLVGGALGYFTYCEKCLSMRPLVDLETNAAWKIRQFAIQRTTVLKIEIKVAQHVGRSGLVGKKGKAFLECLVPL